MLGTSEVRVAPIGFTEAEWEEFCRVGLLMLPNRLEDIEITAYLSALDELFAGAPPREGERTQIVTNIVERHPLLTGLIDHDRHVGYVYDLFGEQLRITQSEALSRPPGPAERAVDWHFDGPRVVPYRTFSPILPLKVKVGYWLTDLPEHEMGNFVFVPSSHQPEYDRSLSRTGRLAGERVLCVQRGTITLVDGNVWHRVEPNRSAVTRKNMFLSYGPSWVCGYDRHDRDWAAAIPREQRIIVRAYDHDPKLYTRPPEEDLPLFLDRETRLDWDDDTDRKIDRFKWRRLTYHEELGRQHRKA